MKSGAIILAMFALIPTTLYADDSGHQGMMPGMMHGMMHGTADAAHGADGGHAGDVGKPGDAKKVSRTIQVVMSDDMKFTPANVNVKRGETIRFALTNAGRIKHEMVIGSKAELREHAALMRKMPGMEHADPNMVTLAPGESGELIWQFTRAGSFDFACLQPGHFEAGMIGKVSVK